MRTDTTVYFDHELISGLVPFVVLMNFVNVRQAMEDVNAKAASG